MGAAWTGERHAFRLPDRACCHTVSFYFLRGVSPKGHVRPEPGM